MYLQWQLTSIKLMGPHTKGRQWSSRGTHWEVTVGEGWAWVEELGVKMTAAHCINVRNQQTIKGWEETDSGWCLCVCSSLPYRSLGMYIICVCMFTYTYMYVNSHYMVIHCSLLYLPLFLSSSKLLNFLLFPLLGIEPRAWHMPEQAFYFWVESYCLW